MTLNLYPSSPAWSFPVQKTPNFATRTQRSVVGRELRVQDYLLPIYTFTLTYEILRDKWDLRGVGGWSFDELRTIWNFYLQQMGATIPFAFNDPTDNNTRSVLATPAVFNFAIGDGTTTAFQMASPLLAPVVPNVITTVEVGGTPTSAYTLDSNTGIITFTSAPSALATIGADYSFYYKVRFGADSLEAENFLYQRWGMKTVKFQSVFE